MSPAPGATLPAELLSEVQAWLGEDPDPGARAELEELVRQGDERELRARFDHPLTFGTAGLRGPLGAGPARMNRAVARRTTAGLVTHLLAPAQRTGTGAGPGVVVGHDARHLSAEMAEDAARVVASRGLRAWWLKSALPTPITAFGVRHFAAFAGVVVTASHNPAADNGYKVYLSDGAQVVPPHDEDIASSAAKSAVPSDEQLSGPFGDRLVEVDEEELLAAYCRAALAAAGAESTPAVRDRLRCVYTPVHGTGGAVLPRLMEEAGFAPPAVVAAQAGPDPDFPTAPFPNPEEPGVLDLALADAERLSADLVLANDPDADRLAVAVRTDEGRYRVLSGDEVGALLADHLISSTSGEDRLVATTVVSSTMLSDLAVQRGIAYVETLTGFKWVARAARLRPGHRLLFGYEEALGYAVTDAVADKDGMSAAVVVADMAARAKAAGRSLLDRLDELDAALGVHATRQWSLRLPGSDAGEEMGKLMSNWRSAPPARLGGHEVAKVRDLAHGEGDLPPTDLLVFYLDGQGRVVMRPSGTEPKLKVYFEAKTDPCCMADLGEARRLAASRLHELQQAVSALLDLQAGP
ncbi:MAG TPA: phospho-sugar mutase [Acidimicrobiales bacterium]|nr:phospho-sugar mutase [Acidimicrobiales bacterium]